MTSSGTGNNRRYLPEDYSLARMADELAGRWRMPGLPATASWVMRFGRAGRPAAGLDGPDALTALVCVNGWLTHQRPYPPLLSRSASVCCGIPAAPGRGSRRSRCFSIRRTGWPPARPALRPKKAGAGPFPVAKVTYCTGLAP